jgi:superfamily II DNA or RNA helicase
MDQLLEIIRKASLPGIWSSGVKLAREQSVSRVSSSQSEAVFRVRAPGKIIAPTVTFYLDDGEWSCDCGGPADPCAHVVAAAIAASSGDANLAKAPADAAPAEQVRLVYRLSKKGRHLAIARAVIHPGGREERLEGALSSELARGRLPRDLSPTHDDIKIDRILGTPAREVVPLERIEAVFTALSSGAEVTWNGEPITIAGEGIAPRGTVDDAPGGGFVLRIERDPAITEVVAMGVARCQNTLRALRETLTTGEFLERLPLTRTFARNAQAELVTNVIPELEKKLALTIVTKKLPRTRKDARPRIAMDLSHQGHTLSILPTMVYGDPPIARIDGDEMVTIGRNIAVRRPEQERELVRRLRDELNLVPGRRVDLDGQEAVRFAAKLRDFQRKTGDESYARVFEDKALTPRLAIDGDRFDVIFERTADGDGDGKDDATTRAADTATVLRAWRDGLELVPLEGGGWAPLPVDWLAKHGHLVADLLAARDETKKLLPAALIDLGALCRALDAPRPFTADKLAPLLDGFTSIPVAQLPEGLNADLRPYQKHGTDWLAFLRDAELGAVLADDMGLGKTLQTIATLEGRTLVVCPKSVVYNWAAEIARFRPSLKTSIYQGAKRSLDPNANVTLVTYAVLRMDVAKLADPTWDTVVLDEAQAIKNAGSQTARAAFRLRGRFRVALSGTPVENRLEELWSVMHFANPGLLGGLGDFDERYSSPISNGDGAAADRLRGKIRPFVLRRMKRDVLPELPPRTDTVLYVELDESERNVYDAVRAATRKEIATKLAEGGSILAALEALLRLRQAACHSSLVPGQHAESSSKIERLLEALEEAASEGHKALVFSQWTSLLDKVEPHLQASNIAFARLDGTTRDRASVVEDFQREDGPPVMLVSLKAGGTGLNLTAADHVFLLDPWWNPAVEDQAADRAHRIGQERPVMVYRMVAKDTVEERIFALQEKKRRLADVALGNADHAGGITREELLALLDI